ncbi:DUF4352 domain-containing protein [Periweissella cryptocerci]|uniref:DUF4352 domain-containing protein n=1 Tax=Periweissella cryptocerci TaxID=2506420 RepID=A0A4P6YS25_9LACO|nr:DUF4352 domain-containing protein [Periweissella cryptocerci]QBO35420.1 DUF4352 domain-containing protein [Periweissella cryptocerci]
MSVSKKKVIGYGIAGIVGLGLIGNFANGSSDTSSNKEASPKSEQTTKSAKAEDLDQPEKKKVAPKKKTTATKDGGIKFGKTAKLGDMKLKITSSSLEDSVKVGESGTLDLHPKTGVKYLVLKFNLFNAGDTTQTIPNSDFVAKIGNKEYAPETILSDDFFILYGINPNLSLDGTVVYEVPASTNRSQVTIEYKGTGWLTKPKQFNIV